MLRRATKKLIHNGVSAIETLNERYFGTHHSNYTQIPGPKRHFIVGNLPHLLLKYPMQPEQVTLQIEKEYGPYAMVWLFNQPMLMLHDPAAMTEVLETKMECFQRYWPINALKKASEYDGELLRNGSDWSNKRKNSFFSSPKFPTWLEESLEPGLEYLQKRLPTVSPEMSPSFSKIIFRFVFDYLSHLTFGEEIGDRAFKYFDGLFTRTNWRIVTNLPLVTPDYAKFKEGWYREIKMAFERNRNNSSEHLLMNRIVACGNLPKEKLPYEVANIFPGGVYSMTTALLHVLSDLSENPSVQAATVESAQGVGDLKNYHSLERCVGMEAALRESLRLHTPVPLLMRRVWAKEVEVGGYRLKRGTGVAMGPAPLHLNAHHWPQPMQYRPSRWDEQVMSENPYGSEYFLPLGRGPRYCIGGDLALFILRTSLYALLTDSSLSFDVQPPSKYEYKMGCTYPSKVSGRLGR